MEGGREGRREGGRVQNEASRKRMRAKSEVGGRRDVTEKVG